MVKMEQTTIAALYTLDETIAKELFDGLTYPWEALPLIRDFIIRLGQSLPEDKYEQVKEHVWIAIAELKKNHPEYGQLLMTVDGVEDADWENNWKAFYKPMEIGERLLVIPDWEEADPQGRVALRMNPGLTFGTGSHATTRLCLTALEREVKAGMRVLDLGCGSGILSIAALLLGAESAFACDIDEKAVGVAYENAALNGIGKDRYAVRAGDVLADEGLRREMGGGYDIVAANIVSDVIIALAPAVRGWMKEGGLFLTSGIIDARAGEVREKLEAAGFAVEEAGCSEGWYGFLCR